MADGVVQEPGPGNRVNAYGDGRMQDYWVRETRNPYWVSRSGVAYTWQNILATARSQGWALSVHGTL